MNLKEELAAVYKKRDTTVYWGVILILLNVPAVLKMTTAFVPDTILSAYAVLTISQISFLSFLFGTLWWVTYFQKQETSVLNKFMESEGYTLVDQETHKYIKGNKMYKVSLTYNAYRKVDSNISQIKISEQNNPVPTQIISI